MKKITLFFGCILMLCTLIPNRANAQWYTSYGVTNLNDLTEPQLKVAMEKAESLSTAGIACGVIGGVVAIIGGAVYASGLSDMTTGGISQLGDNYAKAIAGAYIMGGGVGLIGIGVPLLIVGAMRKSDIEIAMAKFPAKVTFSPKLFRNQSDYGLGLSVAFTF